MKSVTAISSSIPRLNKAFRTLFTHSTTTNPCVFHTLSRNLQNSSTLTFSLIVQRQSHSVNHSFISSHKKQPNFAMSKCISSISSSAHTVDWNDAVSCSEIGETEELALEREEDDDDASATAVKPYIPVRAFFFSTRFGFLALFLIPVQNTKALIEPSMVIVLQCRFEEFSGAEQAEFRSTFVPDDELCCFKIWGHQEGTQCECIFCLCI